MKLSFLDTECYNYFLFCFFFFGITKFLLGLDLLGQFTGSPLIGSVIKTKIEQ